MKVSISDWKSTRQEENSSTEAVYWQTEKSTILMSEARKQWLVGGVAAGFVVLIIAIVFPVFQKVHEGSHRICASQLREIGLALVQYSQDNDEKMPNVLSPDGISTCRTAL